ncbi:hypothetical protein N7481_000585 [Penicillium waksmanii]|uniref:uncharacterized protein n=1 Tax=Penicillium waksmanii TaxID=69791 RepID=UPI002547CFA6|nr:uncharacterized protein N7481_000585 [Penicillium waksmanii]KAJ6000176.1 hypothetical protein N7481_000585 [Penicillium waksmanii]
MECLFSAYVRVTRNLDDADGLLAIFQEFENNPSAISAEDRARLLDFPDLPTQLANITAIAPTISNKQDFLKKAVESPRDLSDPEIDLLLKRYWKSLTFGEQLAFENALDTLTDSHRTETLQRLQKFQNHLYEQCEAKAFENASDAQERQFQAMEEAMEQEEQEELEKMLQHGQPWLRQLWQEDECKKPWGYAMFENPYCKAKNPDRWESYGLKTSGSMHWAFISIGSSSTVQSRYVVEELDWPSGTPTLSEDGSFPVILRELRKHFNYLRSFPPKKEIPDLRDDLEAGNIDYMPEGLTVGTLRNVFLYVDTNAAASVLDGHFANNFWIWAVDPDWVADTENESQVSSGYQGYLRVRLQQLIHNFYVARRWHADEVSLEDLWKVAQKDPHNGSFVSMDIDEIFAWDPSNWQVANALFPRKARQ